MFRRIAAMFRPPTKRTWRPTTAAVIVAHPDDETLWAGGYMLLRPTWNWCVVSLCRRGDLDRNPRFWRALQHLNADGRMSDLDDGPELQPLAPIEVENAILECLPETHYDVICTHAPNGEYTRHIRHEETSRAVVQLWISGAIITKRLMMFAYEDRGGRELPLPKLDADIVEDLPSEVWQQKRKIITEIYGFSETSWESRTTPRKEAFWAFDSPGAAKRWYEQMVSPYEDPCPV